MTLDKITSAILNDLNAGLNNANASPAISELQLEDEVIEMRHAVIKE
jgi:hypothetical protein